MENPIKVANLRVVSFKVDVGISNFDNEAELKSCIELAKCHLRGAVSYINSPNGTLKIIQIQNLEEKEVAGA